MSAILSIFSFKNNLYRARITKTKFAWPGSSPEIGPGAKLDLGLKASERNNKTVVRTRANYLSWPEIRCRPDTAPYFWPTQVLSPGSNNCFVIPWSWP